MAPGVMVTVSKCEKVFWVPVGKTEDNVRIRSCRRRYTSAQTTQTTDSYKIRWNVAHWPRNKPLDLYGNPDHIRVKGYG